MKKLFTLSVVALLAIGTASAQNYRKWDFTNWSPATVANLMADEGWSDIEKANGTAPTEVSKDNCFWEVTAAGTTDGVTLQANGAVIDELDGLLYTNTTNRSLAIAVNYPDVTSINGAGFGPYHGPSYLWLGGSKKNYFVIPKVLPGTTIKMGIESHKLTDARGVNLYLGHGTSGTKLNAPDGSEVSVPTEYTEQEWLVPVDATDTPNADGTYDIQIYNTNGCHIYYIEVGDATQKSTVGYLYEGSIDSELAYQQLSTSSRYDVKPVEVTGALTMEALTQYDAVVISSTVANADALASLYQIQPFVPVLNLNPTVYAAWGVGTTADAGTPFAVVANSGHALFRGLEEDQLIEDPDNPGTFVLALAANVSFQGVVPSGRFADDAVLATVLGNESLTAIHQHSTSRNSYIYIPYTQEVLADGITLEVMNNAISLLVNTKAKVTAAPKPGFELEYKNLNTNVIIKSAVPQAEIFYTLDGSEPTEQSTRYTGPFNLSSETTVKAVARGEGYLLSEVAEQLVDMRHQVAQPAIMMEQQDGKTIVDFAMEEIGYDADVNIYYNYSGSTDVAKSSPYEGPVTVTALGRTIYAFAAVEGYVNSELASAEVKIMNPKVRIDVVSHMDANAAEYNGGSTSTAYYFSWGKNKGTYAYYNLDDVTEDVEIDPETGEEIIVKTYNTLNPEEEKDFENGWMIRSRGQLVIWENQLTGQNIGDTSGYNYATVDDINSDFPTTRAYINLADKNTTPGDVAFPYNAYIVTTQKYAGPFDIVINVGSITKPDSPGKHDIVLETSADGNDWDSSWQTAGDTINIENSARLTRNITRSYEGTEEVYVRAYLCGNNSKTGFYDIYIARQGELSQQRLDEYASGIEELQPALLPAQTAIIYDLQGRRLNGKPAHGLYIQNGRKYVK